MKSSVNLNLLIFNCGIIMTKTPSMRFSKMNWLNFYYDHCSKLAKNIFETIILGDSIVARLSRYQNVRENISKAPKSLELWYRRRHN